MDYGLAFSKTKRGVGICDKVPGRVGIRGIGSVQMSVSPVETRLLGVCAGGKQHPKDQTASREFQNEAPFRPVEHIAKRRRVSTEVGSPPEQQEGWMRDKEKVAK